jgi:hypothetical protein
MGFSTQGAAQFSMATQIGGGVTSAIGAYAGAQASRGAARIDDINARLSELGAQSALMAGQAQEIQSRLSTANLKSTQRATFAANGVDLGEGSAVRTLTSTDLVGEVDANTIKANAVRSAFGYRTQAMNYANDAMQRRAAPGGLMAAGTSLLGSGGQVASSWYRLSKDGAFNSPSNGTSSNVVNFMPQAGP